MPYPNSLLERLILFVKTLRIYIPEKTKDQFLARSIQSLNIYKNAINYQLLAQKSKFLNQEKEILCGKKLLDQLKLFERTLIDKKEVSLDQKTSLREWAGCLVDLHTPIRLDAILDFKKSSEVLLNSIHSIQQNLEIRAKDLPFLIEHAINEQIEFFAQDLLIANRTDQSLMERVQLFSYFISEKLCKETINLHKQIDIAAGIWNNSYKNKYRESLIEFKRFFKNTIEEYGAPWDIANGMAYANLFQGI